MWLMGSNQTHLGINVGLFRGVKLASVTVGLLYLKRLPICNPVGSSWFLDHFSNTLKQNVS